MKLYSHFARFKQFQSSVAVHKRFISRVIDLFDFNFFTTLLYDACLMHAWCMFDVCFILFWWVSSYHGLTFWCISEACIQSGVSGIIYLQVDLLAIFQTNINSCISIVVAYNCTPLMVHTIFKNVDSINSFLCFWIIVTLLSLYYSFRCNQCNMYDCTLILSSNFVSVYGGQPQ